MRPAQPPRGYRSIFRRLLKVFIVGAALVAISIGGFFRWHFAGQGPFRGVVARNLGHYSALLVREIGAPPDERAIRELNAELGIGIRARVGDREIAYPADVPPFSEVKPWSHSWIPDLKTGKSGRSFFALYEPRPGQRYLFVFYPETGSLASPWPWLGLTLSLLLILLFVHSRTRRMFRPLAELTEAVEKVGKGRFDIEFKPRRGRHDNELDLLMDRFQAMASQLARMIRDKEQLLLDVSHELRSPLARSRVALELMPEGATRESLVADLREMDSMIGQLLESARLGHESSALKRQDTSIRAVVEQAVTRVNRGAVEVRVSGGTDVVLHADPERLMTAVRNLIENSVKYTELKGGAPEPVEVSWSGDADGIELTVRDRGVGIPEAELGRVSEPFYRVDRSRTQATGGFGLGLSLARRIVEAHGGTLRIESREAEGTTVVARLPLR